MEGSDSVSVVIPAFRQEGHLRRALESVLRQTHRNFEIHVVDDSGNEDLRPVVEAFPGVTYTPQPQQGPGAARNRGLRMSRGNYIVSLDHDDEWDETYLERAVEAARHLETDLLWMNFRLDGPRPRPDCLAASRAAAGLLKPYPRHPVRLGSAEARQYFLGRLSPLSNSALFLRRECLGEGWYEGAKMADDWLLVTRLLLNEDLKCGIVPAVSWTKHEDGGQLSLWSQETGRRCVEDVSHAWRHFAPGYPEAEQSLIRTYLGNLHYKLAYHCLWAGSRSEAWDNVRKGHSLAGITLPAVSLVGIALLRKGARLMGIPPRSQWKKKRPGSV